MKINVTKVTINIPTTIKEKETMKIDVKLSPSNSTVNDIAITSTDEASIKFENENWYITGEKTGEATITLKSESNNIEKTYKIQVTALLVEEIIISGIPEYIVAGEAQNFNVIVNPSNATDKTYTLTSSENLILSKDGEQNKVTGTDEGNGWIKAVANDTNSIETIVDIPIKKAPN